MSPEAVPLVELRGVHKRFGAVQALRGVDLDVRRGEVHALLGENGAGKSTLVKLLAGVHRADAGEVLVEGRVVRPRSPRAAAELGVALIHQELAIVEELDVAGNVCLGRESRGRGPWLSRSSLRQRARDVLGRLGAGLDPRTPAAALRVGRKQLVAVARALARDARLLLMDEPTSALGDAEVRTLFEVVRRLRAGGTAVVFISHRLDEVFALADRVTVLRDGRRVLSAPVPELSPDRVIAAMLGREAAAPAAAAAGTASGAVVLEARGLGLRRPGGGDALRGVDLTLRAGEVVGLAGLLGAGRTELMECLAGLHARTRRGRILVDGRPVRLPSVRAARRCGIAHLPEDRARDGLLPHRSVRENLLLVAARHRAGVILRRAERRAFARRARALGVTCRSWSQPVADLSGGNQQKVLLGRCLETRPRILLLDEPTRGIDHGTKAEIHRLVAELARSGLAVLLATSELPELLRVCHRVLVLRDGRLEAEMLPQAGARAVLARMAGARVPGQRS